MFEGSLFFCMSSSVLIWPILRAGLIPMPSNSFVPRSRWCYPVVQHLTASAGGGGKGVPGKKKKALYGMGY